jgi:hypothetical protein
LEQVLRVQQMQAQQTSRKVESGIDAEVPPGRLRCFTDRAYLDVQVLGRTVVLEI